MSLSRSQNKGGVIADSPFVHDARLVNLELISPVQIAVEPAPPTSGSAVLIGPEVFLYCRGEIGSIVPQHTPTDAHSRRDEVPQIPLSDYVGPAVELAAIDGA